MVVRRGARYVAAREVATASALILVSQSNNGDDFNNDGCNDYEDMWDLSQFWLQTMSDDPNGDGTINILDFMYINLSDVGNPNCE